MGSIRTAITGMGCILPIGKSPGDSIKNIYQANGNGGLHNFTSTRFGSKPVGLIPDEYLLTDISDRERAKYNRVSILTASVVKQCIESSGIKDQRGELGKTGIISGCSFGCLDSHESFLLSLYDEDSLIDPMKFPHVSHNYPISINAIKYGLTGPITSLVEPMSSSLNALILANYFVSKVQARRMIVVGFDEITETLYTFLDRLGYLPAEAGPDTHGIKAGGPIPFEGCSGIVIEDLQCALDRGAQPLGEICGWSASHIPCEDSWPSQLAGNIKKAIHKAGINKKHLGLLVLNANGMASDDAAESLALERLNEEGYLFDSYLPLKPVIGNYFGAAGLTEMVFTIKMINAEDTVNVSDIQKMADLDAALNEKAAYDTFIINNYGLAGNVVSAVIKKWES